MTGEVFAGKDPRKFIPVLRAGSWQESSPTWLGGKYGVDLRDDPYAKVQYEDLLDTLHGTREQAPPIGVRPTKVSATSARRPPSPSLSPEAIAIVREAAKSDGNIVAWEHDAGFAVIVGDKTLGQPGTARSQEALRDGLRSLVSVGLAEWHSNESLKLTSKGFDYADGLALTGVGNEFTRPAVSPSPTWEPVKITGIIANEVGTPRSDGTRGSALYAVPFQLSRQPSPEWAEHFVQTWNHPPSSSMRHRPGIARVVGDRIILDGTTVDEVAEVHRATLMVVIDKVNRDIGEWEEKKRRASEAEAERLRQHKQAVEDAAKRISFDGA